MALKIAGITTKKEKEYLVGAEINGAGVIERISLVRAGKSDVYTGDCYSISFVDSPARLTIPLCEVEVIASISDAKKIIPGLPEE
jgi:hypothetical protein